MSARARTAVLALGVVILAIGCRWRIEQEEAPAASSAGWLNTPPPEPSVPFTPVPGEAAPAHPCGPKRRGPCLLLAWERYNFAWTYTHAAWFMDTEGREYEFHASPAGRPGVRPEDGDPVRSALIDEVVSAADFDIIVAASKALPRRVTPAELRHAQALLAASQQGVVQALPHGGCHDCPSDTVKGYLVLGDRQASSPLLLEASEGDIVAKEDSARATRELVQWVHQRRGGRRPHHHAASNR
jgi:hypothetical protein